MTARFFTFFLLFVIIFSTSCRRNEINDSTDGPFYRLGIKFLMEGDYEKAAKSFETSFRKRRCYPALLQLANIAEEQRSYEAVLYYCREFLKFAPESDSQRSTAEALLEKARKKLYTSLKGEFKDNTGESRSKFGVVTERERVLMKQLAKASMKNEELKDKLNDKGSGSAVVKPKIPRVGSKPGEKTKDAKGVVVPGGEYKNYTVEKGDNLYKISKKVYGTTKYWKKIFEANKDKMKNESSVVIGMKLKMPIVTK